MNPAPASQSAPAKPPRKKSGLGWWLLGLAVVAATALAVLPALRQRMAPQVEVFTAPLESDPQPGGRHLAEIPRPSHGLPIYPGAETIEEPALVEVPGEGGEPVFIVSARYRTRDPLEDVDAWYRQQLDPKDFEREPPGVLLRRREVFGVAWALQDILYIDDKEQRQRVVVIHRKGPEVEIALARIALTEED